MFDGVLVDIVMVKVIVLVNVGQQLIGVLLCLCYGVIQCGDVQYVFVVGDYVLVVRQFGVGVEDFIVCDFLLWQVVDFIVCIVVVWIVVGGNYYVQ